MRSPAARIILGAIALVALGAAAYLVHQIDRQVVPARAAERAFDLSAREAANRLADLPVHQIGYVADGLDTAVLIPQVKEATGEITKAIAELRSEATTEAARTALDKANELMIEFVNVDQRARDYIKSGQRYMASDVISTEGVQGAADAARQLNLARVAEREGVEASEASLKRRETEILAGAAGVVSLVLLVLVFVAPREKSGTEKAEAGGMLGIAHTTGALVPREEDVEAGVASASAGGVALHEAPPASPYVTARPAGPVLRAASKLCTDLGRVSDLDELKSLIGQAADVMDASGIVIWIAAPDGTYVQPALSHGYAPQVMARMSRILRSADNAAASAYRTGQMQIVLARPGESNGAVVAPLLSSDGCIGALSAEIRGGGESSESVQALAAIVAAQLAGVLNTSTSTQQPRATATGTI
jgi:CHASE3 domain sensor protein